MLFFVFPIHGVIFYLSANDQQLIGGNYYPGPKKIETAMQAKHRRVHAREITRLHHVRAVVSIFLWPG